MLLTFLYPNYLFFMFSIPLFILVHFLSIKFRKRYSLKFANFDSIARIKGVDLYSKNVVFLVISCLVVFILVFSLAGATVKFQGEVSSFSFVIAIDSSRSMEAVDFLPNRMVVAKQTAKEFVDSAPAGTRIGIVSFSGSSVIELEMTDDKKFVKNAINGINITFVGGTDLYESIITSSNLLSSEKNKAIIILSDGQANVGSLENAIEYAFGKNIVVHTIAIGTVEGSNTSYGLSKLDEESLKAIAFNTNGNYFKIEDKGKLQESFNQILELKKGNISYNLSEYLLIVAIVLLLLGYILVNTRFATFP